ncbi:MAG: ATP-binding protein [Cyanobacteria bacterium P01_A01_bin.84]
MINTKILIVEDEQIIAEDISETLEDIGYQVIGVVATGEDAIPLTASLRPNLVLMDILLAGKMDGIEASEYIQSHFHIPVVYLTANADRQTLERVKATHPFGYILKPFDDKILATTIDIALSRYEVEIEMKKSLIIAQNDKQEVEARIHNKSQYMNMAAHELRNPIAAIKLGAEILKYHSNNMPPEKIQRHIQRIDSATDNLNQILEEMLTLGKTESGKMECELRSTDIVTFCEEIIESLRITISQNYSLNFNADTQQRTAWVDDKLLWHLLNNLLSNAIKYSPNGGEISLSLDWEDNYVCLKVKDRGIGIPPEAQAKLFEPFQRANNVGEIPGTGLGLAIVKQCIILHQGFIEVESAINEGTTFIVKLPVGG